MSLKTFTEAYVEAALWSSMDEEGTPLDTNYSTSDIAAKTRKRMAKDCREFYEWDHLWSDAGMSDEQAGYDFWLTRNRHGAGFWDRGLGAVGKTLTDKAHAYGEFDLYIGDDGKVHGS